MSSSSDFGSGLGVTGAALAPGLVTPDLGFLDAAAGVGSGHDINYIFNRITRQLYNGFAFIVIKARYCVTREINGRGVDDYGII